LYVAAPHRDLHQAQIKVFSAPRPLILKQRIPLPQVSGGFNHHAADGKNRHVFLCASANKTVEVLDLTTGRIINSLQQKNRPAATCFTPGINILSVSCGDTVNLYDGDSFKELAVITMPSSIDELRCDSKTNQLFAGCMTISNYGIATIDLVQRKSLGITKSPPPQGFCLEDDGNRIFICSPKTDQVSIVDRNKSAVVDSIKLDDPKGGNPVAYDPATHRLFVGCRKPAKLLVLNTDNGKTIASVDMGMGTDDLSFDPINKRIYVACSQGVISVIQQDNADHFRNIADVPTASGARNCVFIPESGEFCVTVPQSKDQSQPAAVLIYQAQPVK
jgi:DNA-binding beta-propeller fold protein YncE